MARRARHPWTIASLAVAALCLLPFAAGLARGHSFYFRDLTLQFFPWRLLQLEGLRAGTLTYWNPFSHEGEAMVFPPLGYPLELLQLLVPDEWGLSLLMAAHVALAAVSFLFLARGLGVGPIPASAGASAYALGGFALSTVNFYVYLHAAAWAPLAVLGLLRAADGGGARLVRGAAFVGITVSTLGMELVLQALLFGLALGHSGSDRRRLARSLAVIGLGVGLAAVAVLPMLATLGGSARQAGFGMAWTLTHSVHPVTLLQTVVADLHGDLANLGETWWGAHFSPTAFPYVVSLYLGAPVLCLAVVGGSVPSPYRRRLLLLAAVAAWICLGRFGGLQYVLSALPFLPALRFPVKAFFTVHLAVALLASIGLQHLMNADGPWRQLRNLAGWAGGGLLGAAALLALWPGARTLVLAGLFVDGPPRAAELGAPIVLRSVAGGGAMAAIVGLLAALVCARRLGPIVAGATVAAVVGGDLLRAGAGLNPMAKRSFFRPSTEMVNALRDLQVTRLFTCDPVGSPSWNALREYLIAGGRHWEMRSYAVQRETLSMYFGTLFRVRTAYSRDLTQFVPTSRLLSLPENTCAQFEGMPERLRAAGVSHLLALDPIEHPELSRVAVVHPPPIAPLTVYLYALARPLPLVSTERGRVFLRQDRPGQIELEVDSDGPAGVVLREAYDRGWRATVDGADVPVAPDGRHLSVATGPGAHRIRFSFRPAALFPGMAVSGAVVLALVMVWRRERRSAGD